ncbi:MAG: hypothetical protein LAT82_01170 [Nanoarchaeota archaeon]|nr:hypothetical protein [Nanoarchaeota archaeon]
MNSNYNATTGILSKPTQIGNLKLKQTYFIEPNHPTLFVDDALMGIWINLDSTQFSNKQSIGFPISIQRINNGDKKDFKLLSFPSYKITSEGKLPVQIFLDDVYEIFNTAFPLGARENEGEENQTDKELDLEQKIDILHKIFEFDTSKGRIPKNYLEAKDKLSSSVLEKMRLFLKFIKNLRKAPLKELLTDKTKSIIFGTLSMKDELENQVATMNVQYKKIDDNSCQRVFDEAFKSLYLSDSQLHDIFDAIGFKYWSNGNIPLTGGAIFVDYGGTGKSLSKSAIRSFTKGLAKSVKTDCEIKEVTSGEISSYVNSGPQTVQRWYLGSKISDHISSKQPNLVEKARINQFPSFLIVDEAQDLIKSSDLRRIGESDPGTIEPFKRFIQDVNKGGVTGFVITILIANMRPEQIDNPLSQGGERLKTIWFGHPKTVEAWSAVALFQFEDKKLKFNLEYNQLPLKNIGKILLKQQEFLKNSFQIREFEEEKGGVSQRIFGDIVAEFKSRNSNENITSFSINQFRHTEDIDKIFDFISFLEFLIEKAISTARRGGFSINEQQLRNLLRNEINLETNSTSSSNDNHSHSFENVNPQLTQFYNKILKTKDIQISFKDFFEEEDKIIIRRKIVNFIRLYHPDQYQILNDKTIATKILQFLNYCLEEVNKSEFDYNQIIRFLN